MAMVKTTRLSTGTERGGLTAQQPAWRCSLSGFLPTPQYRQPTYRSESTISVEADARSPPLFFSSTTLAPCSTLTNRRFSVTNYLHFSAPEGRSICHKRPFCFVVITF